MTLRTVHSIDDFLSSDDFIQTEHPDIAAESLTLTGGLSDVESVERVFLFVRDEVAHSWDIQGTRVTRSATDVLTFREGICYAKSHLASALLRAAKIPSGICYQRLTLLDDDSAGYVVHALNTAWLASQNRWVRFDARGNKPGVDAQFSLEREQLAFSIRPAFDEVDYLVNHATPHPQIIETLLQNDDAVEMYRYRLPEALQ